MRPILFYSWVPSPAGVGVLLGALWLMLYPSSIYFWLYKTSKYILTKYLILVSCFHHQTFLGPYNAVLLLRTDEEPFS